VTHYIKSHGRPIEVETIDTGVTVKKRRTDPFVKIPLRWASKAAQATNTTKAMVWIRLRHAMWEAKTDTVLLANGRLKRDGVTPWLKRRALRELEAAGLIKVERQTGRAPIVTILL
jgi:hypothetical protein